MGPEILNPRIEVAGQETLQDSEAIWLNSSEQLVVKWDSFTLFYSYGGAVCDFTSLRRGTDDCEICNLCDTSPSFDDLCPSTSTVGLGEIKLRFQNYEGSIRDEPVSTVYLQNTSGCSALGFGPLSFIPVNNSTYTLRPPEGFASDAVLTERKVFLVPDALEVNATYELERYTETSPKVWFRWAVRGSPKWEDNFTSGVRINRIRVLTGRPGVDPATGRFRLEDASPVRPSRIVFLRNFRESEPRLDSDILSNGDEGSLRCYADPNTPDGNIELPRCRLSPGGSTPSGSPPVYAATPTLYDSEKLTWIVEFNPAEGGDFDPTTPAADALPQSALLAIEFTIQKVP